MSDSSSQKKEKLKPTGKEFPAQIFVDVLSEDMSREAVKVARDAFALTITSGDVHASMADFIRKKFDRDFEKGWNCIVGRSFGAFVTHELKSYIYFSVHPGAYILLWK